MLGGRAERGGGDQRPGSEVAAGSNVRIYPEEPCLLFCRVSRSRLGEGGRGGGARRDSNSRAGRGRETLPWTSGPWSLWELTQGGACLCPRPLHAAFPATLQGECCHRPHRVTAGCSSPRRKGDLLGAPLPGERTDPLGVCRPLI